MRILNFGSLNIDHVYSVEHIARPGETLTSSTYQVFAGGKGANQSAALGRAGAPVYHAGLVGSDGAWLIDKLTSSGGDMRFTEEAEAAKAVATARAAHAEGRLEEHLAGLMKTKIVPQSRKICIC